MTITNIEATAQTNYRIWGQNATYATARSTAANLDNQSYVANNVVAAVYYTMRGYINFNTALIPDGDVVSDVKLQMVLTSDSSTTDFDVEICEQNWAAQDPLAAGNMEAAYDGCLAASTYYVWRNTAGISINTQYTSPSLTPGYVNKTGITYYSLRNSLDRIGTTPTDASTIIVGNAGNATAAYRPLLIVTHGLGTQAVYRNQRGIESARPTRFFYCWNGLYYLGV